MVDENLKKVVLNWFPPTRVHWPSPALSVLANSLRGACVPVEVIYWNVILEELLSEYLFEEHTTLIPESEVLSLFYAYIAMQIGDRELLAKQECMLRGRKPQYSLSGYDFQEHIRRCCHRLRSKIVEIVLSFGSQVLFYGMSLHLFQWVGATVISAIIKEVSPDSKILAGGLGTPKMALAFLGNFGQFDFAIWGEGEDAIVKLAKALGQATDFSRVPHLLYREKGNVRRSNARYCYPELGGVRFDFSDYFACYQGDMNDVVLPLEQSRGCHWNKCHFCFLNDGYRYRTKGADSLVSEIRSYIDLHQIYKFSFLDNDLVGRSVEAFRDLLVQLIHLREEYPLFRVELAEIITRGLSRDIIRDMSYAGFQHVQIGYESASDTLLHKINKKNTFASNLLFIKWATFYHIRLGGVNIIRGLLEETESDILEATINLEYLRFFLSRSMCVHSISSLAVSSSSKYYKMLDVDSVDHALYVDVLKENLPQGYVNQDDWFTIYQLVSLRQRPSWAGFAQVENHILDRDIRYTLTLSSQGVLYREFVNDVESVAISFGEEDLEWRILVLCNDQVQTLESLSEMLSLEQEVVWDAVSNLIPSRLIYYSEVHRELVSVINTELVL